MDSSDLVGLTLTELAFLLIFSLLLILALTTNQNQRDAEQAAQHGQRVEHRNQMLQKRLEAVESELAEVKRALDESEAARVELAKRLPNPDELRSRQRPSCREAGVRDGFLASLTILPDGSYQRSGSGPQELESFLSAVSSDLQEARAADCVHQVAVSYSPDTSLATYDRALRALEQHFYVLRRDPA